MGEGAVTIAIKSLKTVYEGWLTLCVATLAGDDGVTFRREIEDHGRAVAVLPYDHERRMALLVRMPRAPVLFCGEGQQLLEAPAGLLDENETPEVGAAREALEETGVALIRLDPIGQVWAMPGVSTERMDLFLAAYRAADRTGPGGGLPAEHENIVVVEMPLAELAALADGKALGDMKTLLLLQTLRLREPQLFV
jgi:nudix-type nucleoside diphosphatase (YffH/AdpP family)